MDRKITITITSGYADEGQSKEEIEKSKDYPDSALFKTF